MEPNAKVQLKSADPLWRRGHPANLQLFEANSREIPVSGQNNCTFAWRGASNRRKQELTALLQAASGRTRADVVPSSPLHLPADRMGLLRAALTATDKPRVHSPHSDPSDSHLPQGPLVALGPGRPLSAESAAPRAVAALTVDVPGGCCPDCCGPGGGYMPPDPHRTARLRPLDGQPPAPRSPGRRCPY